MKNEVLVVAGFGSDGTLLGQHNITGAVFSSQKHKEIIIHYPYIHFFHYIPNHLKGGRPQFIPLIGTR
jgi:hypothetical protein